MKHVCEICKEEMSSEEEETNEESKEDRLTQKDGLLSSLLEMLDGKQTGSRVDILIAKKKKKKEEEEQY